MGADMYIEHTDGDKRFNNIFSVNAGEKVEHPQYKVEGMAVEVKMGIDGLMPFQAYVGGWIQGERHDLRQIRLFLDAVHKAPSFDIWGGSKLLQSSTGLPVYLANGVYDLSEV